MEKIKNININSDCIDHFSKFYWGFLTENKSAYTALKKAKTFIAINKKPFII